MSRLLNNARTNTRKMMKVAPFLLLVVISLLSSTVDCRHLSRHKRRIDEFGSMISAKCTIGPLAFNGYGNWCGLGGSGDTVDEIDNCCKIHDGCYAYVNRHECESPLPAMKYKVYTTTYTWQNDGGEITCTDDEPCPRTLCQCDRAAAVCFGQHQDVYNKANKHSAVLRGIKKLLGMAPTSKKQ